MNRKKELRKPARIHSKIKRYSRNLRRSMTEAERRLWSILRKKQLNGYRFRRQHPIGNYIVDFVCLEARLIIEVDGGQHSEMLEQDEIRTRRLEQHGFKVLRYWNNDVFGYLDIVGDEILRVLDSIKTTPSQPSP